MTPISMLFDSITFFKVAIVLEAFSLIAIIPMVFVLKVICQMTLISMLFVSITFV